MFIYRAEQIFWVKYTILTFFLAAAHVDDVAEVKPHENSDEG